jgi:ABC-type siderophore export system fused ATPase/permease subunit
VPEPELRAASLSGLRGDGQTVIPITRDGAVARHAERVLDIQDGEYEAAA